MFKIKFFETFDDPSLKVKGQAPQFLWATLTRFKLLRELTRVFAPLTSNIQIITLYHQLSYRYRRTGLMLSRGAVESLPELLWSWIVMKLPAFN